MKETDLFVVQRPTGVDSGTYKVAASDIPANAVVSGTAPTDPMDGALWLDTNSDTLKTWDGSAWVEPPPGGVTSIIAGAGISVDQATGDVTITNTGGGGGGTPVPQKVAYLKDEKPNGTDGGTSVTGWQDRTLNTKDDVNNLVVLGNDKEFTLSAGEYQIEWSAPVHKANRHQTKLTNVTDDTTQEMGSSEYAPSGGNVSSASYGSTRVKITTNTTYKIEHYIELGLAGNGLGSDSSSGEPEVYTQVIVTDLAIVGGTGTAANTNIYGTAKAWGSVASDGTFLEGTNIASVTRTATGNYAVVFTTPFLTNFYSVSSSFAGTASTGNLNIVSKTTTGFTAYTYNPANNTATDRNFDFSVFDNEPAEVALTTFGDVINYSGPSAWGQIAADGTIDGGLNIASATRTGTGNYEVVFTTPMPDANYSIPAALSGDNDWGFVSTDSKTTTGFTAIIRTSGNSLANFAFSFTVHATNALPPKGGTGTDAWGSWSDATGDIRASFNIDSIVKTATGQYTVTFTTPLPTGQYSVTTSSQSRTQLVSVTDKSSTGFRVNTTGITSSTREDASFDFQVNATNAQLPDTFTIEQFNDLVARVTALENA